MYLHPVGRNCRHSPIPTTLSTSAMTLSVQGSPVGLGSNAVQQNSAPNDIQLLILAKLTTVADRIESIDQRVASNERAIAAQNLVLLPSLLFLLGPPLPV